MNNRQQEILRIIIQQYIGTARPISSTQIVELLNEIYPTSSATVRNDCAELEKLNYLTKSHGHSGGRVPTTHGYRYYIDTYLNTNNNSQLIEATKIKLHKLFSKRALTIENLLNESGKIISNLTNVTSVVVQNDLLNSKLKFLKLINLTSEEAVILFVLDNGHVENVKIQISNYSLNELEIVIDLFNQHLTGLMLSKIPNHINLIKPILQQQIKHYEMIIKEFLQAMLNFSKINHQTYGIHNMLQNPEFKDVNKIMEIIDFIESVSPFVYFKKLTQNIRDGPSSLNKIDDQSHDHTNNNNNNNNISIKIGDEITTNQDDKDVAMFISTYENNKTISNGLIFIGPKRMEYTKIKQLLTWLNEQIKIKFYKNLDSKNVQESK